MKFKRATIAWLVLASALLVGAVFTDDKTTLGWCITLSIICGMMALMYQMVGKR